MNALVHYLPLATTAFAAWFAPQLFRRWLARRPAPHLFWWGIGVTLYGVGTLTESLTTLLGWHDAVFRLWYITGALLGGAPLAQGTAYLLLRRKVANGITMVLGLLVAIAATGLLLSPIDASKIEVHRLSGAVIGWTWVRAISPFINSYAFLMLVGGALVSAWRYRGIPEHRGKVQGNLLIACGGILPGIGGAFTRFGHVEVLYVTELIGLLLIYGGYRANIAARAAPARTPPAVRTDDLGVLPAE
jgi:hypothetical protein